MKRGAQTVIAYCLGAFFFTISLERRRRVAQGTKNRQSGVQNRKKVNLYPARATKDMEN